MGVYRYPPEVHEFVKEMAPKLRDRELAVACNEKLGTSFTASSMKAFRGNHGYRNYKGKWTSEEYWKYQTKYPKGMYEFIRDNSWHVPNKDMAEIVNKKFGTDFTPQRMKAFRQRNRIKSGLTGWYQRGHEPGTKGKTIEEICKHDPEKIARVKASWFPKGHQPHNGYPVGTIVANADGYLIRKKQMEGTLWERWEFLHRVVWEEHNGPIPDGKMVIFRDGDRSNCDISNLMLVTKGENAALNRLGLRSEDPDLLDTGLAVVRLRQAAKDAKKRLK